MYLLAKNRGIVSKLLYLIKDTNPQTTYQTILFRISLTPCFGISTASAHQVPKDVQKSENSCTGGRNSFCLLCPTNELFTLRQLIRRRLRNCHYCFLLRNNNNAPL